MRAADDAGANFIVLVFSWRDIEPVAGYWYWQQTDATIRGARHYGLDVVARLDRPPDWALSGDNQTPWRTDAYAQFAAKVAERYADELAGVILWNEPNLALEWNNQTPDPAGYVDLLEAGYAAVKTHAPDLPVAMAGLAFTLGDGTHALNDLEYLQAVYDSGGSSYFDVLALHPYGFGQPPEAKPQTDALNYRRLELHRQIMVANGDADKPSWITEMGWRTSAPDTTDAWQVVTPEKQTAYSLKAIELTSRDYPWIDRLAFWEINGESDKYGYALWQGPNQVTPAYSAIAGWASAHSTRESNDLASPEQSRNGNEQAVEILASDAIVRLGSVGTLHPHWVHLYRDERASSLVWKSEFYLPERLPKSEWPQYDLLVETMQVDEPTNQILLNGVSLARLKQRPRLDPTSTWVTQRFSVNNMMLRPGVNELELRVGLRNPVRQHGGWRHENLQVRNIRLLPASEAAKPIWTDWQQIQSPVGWGEVNRMRLAQGAVGDETLWVTSNEMGGLWAAELDGDSATPYVANQAGDHAELVFVDVLQTDGVVIAATDQGMLLRMRDTTEWVVLPGAPDVYTYFVAEVNGRLYAGTEGRGIWTADGIDSTWRQDGLDDLAVLDIAYVDDDTIFVSTNVGVYRKTGPFWLRLPGLPNDANEVEPFEKAADFVGRLHLTQSGELIVFNQNSAWVWRDGWQPYGPNELQGIIRNLVSQCGAEEPLVTDRHGLWELDSAGAWQRTDGGFLDDLELVGGLCHQGNMYVAATNGLMRRDANGEWSVIGGMDVVLSDIEVVQDAAYDVSLWIVGTQMGVYRSQDQGATWERISPPWVLWDLAWDGDRLFAGRRHGIAWTDGLYDNHPQWTETEGLGGVTFFRLMPDRTDNTILWGGTWGNNIGMSTDRGASMSPLHNGLETLSVLDLYQHETPGQITIGTIEGIFRSDDDGESWFKLPGPLSEQTVYTILQTVDGALWAGAANGLWVSLDYGSTWKRTDDVPIGSVLNMGILEQAEDSLIWAATEGHGLWISRDHGQSWQLAGLDGLAVYAAAADGDLLLTATSQGLYSIDIGSSH